MYIYSIHYHHVLTHTHTHTHTYTHTHTHTHTQNMYDSDGVGYLHILDLEIVAKLKYGIDLPEYLCIVKSDFLILLCHGNDSD